MDNFRAALDWLFQTQDLDWSLRLCVALFRFWDMREHLSEGRAQLEKVLRLAGTERTRDRARVSQFIGALATAQGDFKEAELALQQGLDLYEEVGDEPGIAASLNALAVSARDRGDYAAAQKNFERSLGCWRLLSDHLAIARCLHNFANVAKFRGDYQPAREALLEAADIFEKLGDRSGAAWSINQQGDIARESGDIISAREFYRRALSAFGEAGDPWGSARSLTDLAYIECEQAEHSAARSAFREAMEIFASLGQRRGIARVLEGCASLALAEGHAPRALTLAAAARQLRRLIGASLSQSEQSGLDRKLAPAWKAISQFEGKVAWTKGSAMSLEDAMQYSLEEPDTVSLD
jgi:tetratricopeptide (TPR) repeat protein